MLDRAQWAEGAAELVSYMTYAEDSALLRAHVQGHEPVVAGTLLIEQAAQSGLLLGQLLGVLAMGRPAMLGRVQARFREPVRLGSEVCCRVRMDLSQRRWAAFSAVLDTGGVEVGRVSCIAHVPADGVGAGSA